MSDIHIGGRIRELREVQNYTREVFAEKVDISSKFLYEIETGKKGFSADTLGRIAQALSVSCDYIMFGEVEKHQGAEKIICGLETLKPTEVSRIQDILKILYDMCDVV